jgi:hypothetical protein
MPTVQDTAKLLDLKRKIEGLTAANRLRLCAGLLERGEYDIVETLVSNVVDELRALRLLRNRAVRGERT